MSKHLLKAIPTNKSFIMNRMNDKVFKSKLLVQF